MVHTNEDAMNKIPLKSASGLDDEEKNGGEFLHDTAASEEARREQMRVNILQWMKKLTIVLICFVGIALISYVVISLCFSDWTTKSSHSSSNSSLLPDDNNTKTNTDINATASSSSDISGDGGNHHIADIKNTAVASLDLSNKSSTQTTAAPATPTGAGAGASNSDGPNTASVKVSEVRASYSTTAAPSKPTEKPQEKHMLHASSTSPTLQDMPITEENFQSKLGIYEKAAVCSDKEVCSQIGSKILEEGGSAVDSAIATLLCNGIVNMHSLGIGGGMFMNVYIKDSQHAYAIDAREIAPFAATPEMFDQDSDKAKTRGLSIAVPGELMGYHKAHERFGKLPWKKLVEPSIKLCHEGFYLSHHLFNALNNRKDVLKDDTVLINTFINTATGEFHPPGTKLQPPKQLCETYALLAKNGPLDFYNGTLSELVAADLKDLGSTITAYDLESYFADLVSSISMQIGDDILYAVPPVSSGVVVANILSVLEGYNFTKQDLDGAENEATTIHRFAEAMKFAYAKRLELGDLRFNDVRELVSQLTNPDYGNEIRKQINDSTTHETILDYGVQYSGVEDYGTSHTVVLAPNGDAVSATSSVNDYFGSGQAGKRTGIIFNCGMWDFSRAGTTQALFGFPPSPSNFIDARKRPMSSMSPMILVDSKGDIRMVLGAAGGSKIISSVVEVAARTLWFGQNIKEAIDAPRFHHQLLPNILEYQKGGFSEEVLKILRAKGHETKSFSDVGSVACGIVRNKTAIYSNADYRKQGGTAGF